MGYRYESFDVYEYRGEKLRDILEQYLSKGNIAAMIYSNPNNPAWFCLTEEELKIIGDMANKYDTIVIEDLAYFAMDFRKPLGKPFEAPFQATVAVIRIITFYKFQVQKHSAMPASASASRQSPTNCITEPIPD